MTGSTELEVPIDAEVVTLLDENAARKLDTRIRLTAGTVRDNFAKLQDYVHEAKTGEIHLALGFKSWTAYLADALGERPLMVDREQRRELVEYLSSEGMSTRAIATVTGVNRETVRQEVKATAGDKKLSSENRTTGLDGKEYSSKRHQSTTPKSTARISAAPSNCNEAQAPTATGSTAGVRHKLNREALSSLVDTIQAINNLFRDMDECPTNIAADYRGIAHTAVVMCQGLERKFAQLEESGEAR
ncbi:hypothetical protein GS584_18965 [Rhodococcus hoagii]|nr:hypothetical protein [Prescottella equi]